jgi:hypothetical protein
MPWTSSTQLKTIVGFCLLFLDDEVVSGSFSYLGYTLDLFSLESPIMNFDRGTNFLL